MSETTEVNTPLQHSRLHWMFGLLVKLKDVLHFFFFTHLWSLFERRALMGRSTSQNPQAMAPLELMQCTVAIATPPLCPDHHSTSTDQVRGGQKKIGLFFFAQLGPVSPTSPVSLTSCPWIMSRVDVLCFFILSKQRHKSLFPFL